MFHYMCHGPWIILEWLVTLHVNIPMVVSSVSTYVPVSFNLFEGNVPLGRKDKIFVNDSWIVNGPYRDPLCKPFFFFFFGFVWNLLLASRSGPFLSGAVSFCFVLCFCPSFKYSPWSSWFEIYTNCTRSQRRPHFRDIHHQIGSVSSLSVPMKLTEFRIQIPCMMFVGIFIK